MKAHLSPSLVARPFAPEASLAATLAATPSPAVVPRSPTPPPASLPARWRRGCRALAAGLVACWLGAVAMPTVQAQETLLVPELLNYQGVLETLDGTKHYTNGLYDIQFRIWSAATAGTLLWGQQYSVYVKDGYFNVILGASGGTALSNPAGQYNNLRDVFRTSGGNTGRFLGITVKQDENHNAIASPIECSPRQQWLTTSFAFQAQYAQYANEATNKFYADKGLTVSGDELLASAGLRSTKGLTVAGSKADLQNGLSVAGSATFANGISVSGAQAVVSAGMSLSGSSSLQGNLTNNCTTFNGGFIPVGGIIMWSGATNTLPNGWALCNGQTVNGQLTPDLRDRFIVGIGTSYAMKVTGGVTNLTLETKHLPAHAHTYKDGFVSEASDKSHTSYSGGSYDDTTSKHVGSGSTDDDNNRIYNRPMSTDNAGQSSPTTLENRPPYYALAFIMRFQ